MQMSAKTEELTAWEDSVSFMIRMGEFGNAHKGEVVAVLSDEFKKNGMPIKFIGFGTTSPWIHPQGKAYINRITISCVDGFEYCIIHKPFPVLQIYLQDAYMDADYFDKNFFIIDKEVTAEEQMEMIKGLFKIGSVEYMIVPRDTSKAK